MCHYYLHSLLNFRIYLLKTKGLFLERRSHLILLIFYIQSLDNSNKFLLFHNQKQHQLLRFSVNYSKFVISPQLVQFSNMSR